MEKDCSAGEERKKRLREIPLILGGGEKAEGGKVDVLFWK